MNGNSERNLRIFIARMKGESNVSIANRVGLSEGRSSAIVARFKRRCRGPHGIDQAKQENREPTNEECINWAERRLDSAMEHDKEHAEEELQKNKEAKAEERKKELRLKAKKLAEPDLVIEIRKPAPFPIESLLECLDTLKADSEGKFKTSFSRFNLASCSKLGPAGSGEIVLKFHAHK